MKSSACPFRIWHLTEATQSEEGCTPAVSDSRPAPRSSQPWTLYQERLQALGHTGKQSDQQKVVGHVPSSLLRTGLRKGY